MVQQLYTKNKRIKVMNTSTLLVESKKINEIKKAVKEAEFQTSDRYSILVPKERLERENSLLYQLPMQIENAKQRGDREGYIVAVVAKGGEFPLKEGDRVFLSNAEMTIIPIMGVEIVLVETAYFVASSNLKFLEK